MSTHKVLINQLWSLADIDSSGSISKDECRRLLKHLGGGQKPTDEQVCSRKLGFH